jgi:hypothetical protein
MARAPKPIEQGEAPTEPVTETITYIPGSGDPSSVKWGGHVFQANVPKEITGHLEGSEREKMNMHLIERARENKTFKVGSASARPKRETAALPRTAEEYRAYVIDWLKDPNIEHADQLIARWARDRDLQMACEVGADDYSYIATLFMPKLHELARADELTEAQLSSVWINHGINQLPW